MRNYKPAAALIGIILFLMFGISETSAFSSENVPSDNSSADRQIAEDTEKYSLM